MGKRAGICGGVGGSQHIAADGFKSNGIQGGIVPAATGIALACRLKGEGAVSVVFLGDGTLGEGAVYESLNIASLWKLPILFVLENNLWSQSTPIHLNLAGDIAARFEAFGIATISVKSTDVLELDLLAHRALREVRETSTPRALIIETYRLCHHSKNDDSRPASEVEAHRVNEPLLIHGPRLDGAVKRSIEHGVEQALEEVVTIARGLT
jgi:acetoin:2,6-dichlorophenolindophenol oxidoreductase subunit alpha